MASQDARLSKFEADFKQQQSERTNKIDTVLKAITDRIAGALPSDTIKNPKLKENEEEEKENPKNIHVNPSAPPDPSISFIIEKVLKLNSFFESLGLVPQSYNTELVCAKVDDGDVMFIEIVKTSGDSRKEEHEAREQEVEYFDVLSTRSELEYHKYLMCGPISSIFLRNPIIMEGCPSNLKIPCNIGHVHVERAYIDLNSPLNIMTRNFTYVIDFMIVEEISSIIDPRLSQVVLGRPFVKISNMTHDSPKGVVRFTNGATEVAYKMPYKIE
ncbi:hypothetical protein Tco_0758593 [Tanacetum coccineum]